MPCKAMALKLSRSKMGLPLPICPLVSLASEAGVISGDDDVGKWAEGL